MQQVPVKEAFDFPCHLGQTAPALHDSPRPSGCCPLEEHLVSWSHITYIDAESLDSVSSERERRAIA